MGPGLAGAHCYLSAMAINASATAGPQISVSVSVIPPNNGVGSLGGVLIVDEHTAWSELVRRWDGDAATVRANMIAAGLSPHSGTVRQAYSTLRRKNAPSYILTGRRDIAHPNWTAALDAIKAAMVEAGETAKYLLTPIRTESVVRTFFAWATANAMLPASAVPSSGIRSNAVGSLEKLIRADGSQGILIYHDPAVASAAAPPAATTTAGPWAITPGAAMSVTQDSEEPETCVFDAAVASVTGTGDSTFTGADGDHLDFRIDGGATTYIAEIDASPAVLTASLSEPYALVDGQVVEVEISGVIKSWAVDALNYGVVGAATAAEMATEANDVAALGTAGTASGAGGVFKITSAKSGNAQYITLTANTDATWAASAGFTLGQAAAGAGNVGDATAYTNAELVDIVTAETGNDQIGFASTTKFGLRGLRAGTGGSVQILASSTAGMLTELGLSAGTTAGTGDAADAGAVTRSELFDLVDTDITEPTVSTDIAAGTVTITGDLGSGTDRTLLIAGQLADETGLAGDYTGEGAEDDYADGAWVGTRAGLALDQAPPNAGPLSWDNVAPGAGLYGDKLQPGEVDRLINVQHVNTLTVVRTARGPEFHDGRLVSPYENGQPAYADQWVSAHWIAAQVASVCKDDFDRLTDGGGKISYFSSDAYAGFLRGSIQRALETAYTAGHSSGVDMEPPTDDKPTGVIIVPKSQLSASTVGSRKARALVYVELAGALQGVIVEISLFAN